MQYTPFRCERKDKFQISVRKRLPTDAVYAGRLPSAMNGIGKHRRNGYILAGKGIGRIRRDDAGIVPYGSAEGTADACRLS